MAPGDSLAHRNGLSGSFPRNSKVILNSGLSDSNAKSVSHVNQEFFGLCFDSGFFHVPVVLVLGGFHCETELGGDRGRHTTICLRGLRLHTPFVSRYWVLAALLAQGCCLGLLSLTSVYLLVRTKLPITEAIQLVVD